MEPEIKIKCAHCGAPVLPETMVKVGEFVFHWECVWSAGRAGLDPARHPRVFSMRSAWSGKTNELVIWMTDEQFAELQAEDRRKIQDILPEATAEEREFLISGMTPAEQHQLFGEQ